MAAFEPATPISEKPLKSSVTPLAAMVMPLVPALPVKFVVK